MAMRSSTSPRRVYPRAGSYVVCYGGVYFGPKGKEETKINTDKEVKIEVLDNSGGKKRIQVSQKVGSKPAVTETWTEKNIVFEKRA